MALPEGFNEWEFLQDALRKNENRKVLKFFSDLGGEDWDPDVSTNKGSLRHACTHKDDDTAIMTMLRSWLFYFAAFSNAPYQYEQVPVYGTPVADFQQSWRFHPQVKLHFIEDPDEVEPGYDPVYGEIGFRLIGETSQSITQAEAARLGTRIEQTFNASNGYRWHKGWSKSTYLDKERGYDFRLLVFDEPEGQRIIRDVMEINNHVFQSETFQYSERGNPSAAFPTLPGNVVILGESRRQPRRRPRAYVRFRYAHLHIHGLPKPLVIASNLPGLYSDVA